MDKKKLLEVRNVIKAKKPKFGRKDSNKKKRIESDVWRKARGCDNKQRLKRKGHKKTPKQGFRSPLEIRGMDQAGFMPVLVTSPKQLSTITKDQGIIVSSSLGNKTRMIVLEDAKKKGIAILNLDAQKSIEQISAEMKERQQKKKKEAEEEQNKAVTEKAKKEAKKAEQKLDEKAAEQELSEDEKKKQEKEEKDKVLTMKQ